MHYSTVDVQVLNSRLARLTGAGKSLLGMDLSVASAELQRMDGECRCPLEMLRCVNEADRCLAESASRLRYIEHPCVAVSACQGFLSTCAEQPPYINSGAGSVSCKGRCVFLAVAG